MNNMNQPAMSSMRPPGLNQYSGNNVHHPGFNPYFQPMMPKARNNRYDDDYAETPPARKRRHKTMELEELNENIELMQEELNKNLSI